MVTKATGWPRVGIYDPRIAEPETGSIDFLLVNVWIKWGKKEISTTLQWVKDIKAYDLSALFEWTKGKNWITKNQSIDKTECGLEKCSKAGIVWLDEKDLEQICLGEKTKQNKRWEYTERIEEDLGDEILQISPAEDCNISNKVTINYRVSFSTHISYCKEGYMFIFFEYHYNLEYPNTSLKYWASEYVTKNIFKATKLQKLKKKKKKQQSTSIWWHTWSNLASLVLKASTAVSVNIWNSEMEAWSFSHTTTLTTSKRKDEPSDCGKCSDVTRGFVQNVNDLFFFHMFPLDILISRKYLDNSSVWYLWSLNYQE